MRFHIGQRAQLSQEQLNGIARYRHAVFVEALGWCLPCCDGLEQDEFDRESAVYVFADDEARRITAFARLLPTTHPYPLAEVFPELLGGKVPPSSGDTWELSRFCATGADISACSGWSDTASAPLAVALLQHALWAAEFYGAQRLITVSPIGIESLLRKAGFHSERFSGPVRYGAKRLVVCDISVPRNRPLSAPDAASAAGVVDPWNVPPPANAGRNSLEIRA